MKSKPNSKPKTGTNGTKFIGAHIDSELHKRIKIKCTEKGVTLHEAIVKGLFLFLDIEVNEELSEELCAIQ